MNTTFAMENEIPNMALNFFPQNPPCWLNESQKTSFEGTFSSISAGSTGLIVTKKMGFSYVRTRTKHVNFMKIGSKLRPVS